MAEIHRWLVESRNPELLLLPGRRLVEAEELLAAGADDFISRPIDDVELVAGCDVSEDAVKAFIDGALSDYTPRPANPPEEFRDSLRANSSDIDAGKVEAALLAIGDL